MFNFQNMGGWQDMVANLLQQKGSAINLDEDVESPNPAGAHQSKEASTPLAAGAMATALMGGGGQPQQASQAAAPTPTPAPAQQAKPMNSFAPNHFSTGYNPRVEQGRNFTDVYFDAKDKADKSFFEAFGKFLGGIMGS